MRDDAWLFSRLDKIWDQNFLDVPQDNDVKIVWGRRAKRTLGSIKRGKERKGEHPETIITINSLFRDPKIPVFVVDATIAHEMAHYAHGFHSPIPQKHATPHAGGVIHKELRARGLSDLEKRQKRWLKENWRHYVEAVLPQKPGSRRRPKLVIKWY